MEPPLATDVVWQVLGTLAKRLGVVEELDVLPRAVEFAGCQEKRGGGQRRWVECRRVLKVLHCQQAHGQVGLLELGMHKPPWS